VTHEEENADLKRQLVELQRENHALRQELEKLRKEIEEWKRGFRERGKRRSSKGEGQSGDPPKKPGQKPGHPGVTRPLPDRIDGTVEHPAPKLCDCGGSTVKTDETESVVVQDIPKVSAENILHVAAVGRCQRCGKRVVAKLPGSVPGGHSVAKVQLGPNVLAFALGLRFEHHVPLAGIASLLDTWFDLKVTAGGLSQLFARWGARSGATYQEILTRIRASAVVGADETGLRQNGVSGWVWLIRTAEASLFRIELSRAEWVIAAMLGEAFHGILCSDYYSVYTSHDDWIHAYCSAHTIREDKKIAELSHCPVTEEFQTRLRALYRDAEAAQASGDLTARRGIRIRMGRLIADAVLSAHPDVARLQARLHEHFHGVLTFLDHPDVPADNNATERDIRAMAVHRKVTGGTRSPIGSQTLAHWLSITQTRRKNDLPLRSFILDLHQAHQEGRPPPSVFN
jgi:hypothetical protein